MRHGVGWEAWWRQANEHRLVLPKALFWMEYTWFGGQQVFLIIMNYVLVGCGLAVFAAFLRDRLPAQPGRSWFFGVTLLAIGLFSWVQKENLAWANQGQFFLAQVLPLVGFYCLYRAACAPTARGWFPAASLIGVLSVGTMANGVMALPMMVLYAAVARLGRRRTLILAVLTAICAGRLCGGLYLPSGIDRRIGAVEGFEQFIAELGDELGEAQGQGRGLRIEQFALHGLRIGGGFEIEGHGDAPKQWGMHLPRGAMACPGVGRRLGSRPRGSEAAGARGLRHKRAGQLTARSSGSCTTVLPWSALVMTTSDSLGVMGNREVSGAPHSSAISLACRSASPI